MATAPLKDEAWVLPVTRAQARAEGSTRYFTGVPCVNGHLEIRATTSGHCLQCDRDRAKARLEDPVYRELHRRLTLKSKRKTLSDPTKRAAIRARAREVGKNNPERIAGKAEKDRIRNQREEVKARRRELQRFRYARALKSDPKYIADRKNRTAEWAKLNRDVVNAKTAKRRAARRRALPRWISEAEREEMRLMYSVASRVSRETGVCHEIDHIFPLQSESVCGFHVPSNLQLLSQTANRSKGNKFNEVEAWRLAN